MIIVPYKPTHLENLLLQPAQAYMRPIMEQPQYAPALAIPGCAFTALDGDTVLGCAGIMPLWENRAEAWALMGADLKRYFVQIHRATLRFLTLCTVRRIEATCDAHFCDAKRWIEMLGFEYEGPLKAYTPDGRDALRYARIK